MTDVVHVLHTFPPETRGGVQRYVERVALALRSRGRSVAIACATANDEPSNERYGELDVHRLPALDPFEQLAADGPKALRWTQILDHLDPAVVHVHHWQGVPLDVLARARAEGARTVVTLHDFHTTCPMFFRLRDDRELCAPDVDVATCAACVSKAHGVPEEVLRESLPRRNAAFVAELRRADAVLCASRAQRAYWRRVPQVAEIDPLVAPLPGPGSCALGEHPDAGERPLVVATWGGLVRGKGVHVLLDAIALLPAGSVRVHHFGPHLDAEYADEQRAHPASAALELHGPFAPDDLIAASRRFHLAVHPSLYLETHGLTTDEALALGLPVVVPDRGAPQERIGERGTTFRVGDAQDLARVLRGVLEDPSVLARWREGEAGPSVSLDEHLDVLERVYDSVLDPHASN
ncbi:MAG: glycosyltransferase [Planctomycetota bacterium]